MRVPGKGKVQGLPKEIPIKSAMREATSAVSRCRSRWLATKYWSIAAQRGKKKTLVAILHQMLLIIYSMLINKDPFKELKGDIILPFVLIGTGIYILLKHNTFDYIFNAS